MGAAQPLKDRLGGLRDARLAGVGRIGAGQRRVGGSGKFLEQQEVLKHHADMMAAEFGAGLARESAMPCPGKSIRP